MSDPKKKKLPCMNCGRLAEAKYEAVLCDFCTKVANALAPHCKRNKKES